MSPGSQLSHAGLNVGEIIMSEGETMVASREALIGALNAAGPDEPIELMTAFYSYKVLVDKSATGPMVGVSLQDVGSAVMVAGMTDDSAAGKAGLKVDDEVLSINGKICTQWTEAVEEIKSAERWVEFVVKGENETTAKTAKKTLVERDPAADGATWAAPLPLTYFKAAELRRTSPAAAERRAASTELTLEAAHLFARAIGGRFHTNLLCRLTPLRHPVPNTPPPAANFTTDETFVVPAELVGSSEARCSVPAAAAARTLWVQLSTSAGLEYTPYL